MSFTPDEDKLNMSIRKFLKKVGITSQREIENAVRAVAEQGRLQSGASVTLRVQLVSPEIGLDHSIEDEFVVE